MFYSVYNVIQESPNHDAKSRGEVNNSTDVVIKADFHSEALERLYIPKSITFLALSLDFVLKSLYAH